MAALRIRRISRHLSGRSRRFQMPESLYEKERRIGIKAVLKASRICISVFDRIASQGITVIKEDRSPVTIADYAAQAVINTVLHESFPSDIIVGEEDADELSQQPALLASVLSLVRSELGPDFSSEQVIKAINLGNGSGGKGRFWTLDPIDGTKGFLRGDQFAVCLALIVDGQVEVSIMGCPNLPMDLQDSNSPRGSLFVGVRGQGAFQRSLNESETQETRIQVSPVSNSNDAKFCESFESGHSSHSHSAQIAQSLGITKASLRMDSQCKYGLIARGDAEIYLRFQLNSNYQENIWDHAGGYLLVTESGGVVHDSQGRPLDFTRGRKLLENKGVIATNGKFSIMEQVNAVLGSK